MNIGYTLVMFILPQVLAVVFHQLVDLGVQPATSYPLYPVALKLSAGVFFVDQTLTGVTCRRSYYVIELRISTMQVPCP